MPHKNTLAIITLLLFAGSSYGQQSTPTPLPCRAALDIPYTTADLRTERFKFLRIVDSCRIAVSDAAGRERMFYMDLGGAASGVLRVIAGRPLAQLKQVELQLTRTDRVVRLFAADDPPPRGADRHLADHGDAHRRRDRALLGGRL